MEDMQGIAERAVALIENTLADPLGSGAEYPLPGAKDIDGFDSWFRNQGGAYSAAVLASLAADCARQCSQMPGSSATQYQEHTLNLKPLFDLKVICIFEAPHESFSHTPTPTPTYTVRGVSCWFCSAGSLAICYTTVSVLPFNH